MTRAADLPTTVPTLRGHGVVLRPFRDDDAHVVREASADPHIPSITTVPATPDEEAARAYLRRQHARLGEGVGYSFAVADPADDRAVGQIGLWVRDLPSGRVTVGYWIAPSRRRRGYATAAIACVSDWGLSLSGVARVDLSVEPWNAGSWRAAEAAGFRREGLLRRWQPVAGEPRDMFMYSRVPGDEPSDVRSAPADR